MTTDVLVLCTHNSARSVLGEAMLNHWAARRDKDVRAHSAGSAPSGTVHPLALDVLRGAGIDVAPLHSKSWDAFGLDASARDLVRMRVVITVCDAAAAETCPYWPGSPVHVHWGYADPSRTVGDDAVRRAAFELARQAIGYRMLQLLELPFDALSDAQLQRVLVEIAHS